MTRELSGELDYRLHYDVEHDLFNAQNVFNDEYIKPTFIEYVQNLEQENAELKKELKDANEKVVHLACNQNKDLKYKLTKAKGLLRAWFQYCIDTKGKTPLKIETAQFLKEIEK